MAALKPDGFLPDTREKVDRLLSLLDAMQRHPDLKGKLAMHGGTAINLFMLDVPRLSVDIDISYVGAISKNDMQEDRPSIERAITEVAEWSGYDVSPTQGGHAGRTFVLNYRGAHGRNHIKVDCIYMNRSPLLPIEHRRSPLRPDLEVPMFSDAELAGGKVKAFFDRIKIRDIYDLTNLKRHYEEIGDPDETTHKILLYYTSLSACFPNSLTSRPARFANLVREFESQLVPMLNHLDDCPKLEELVLNADGFIRKYVLPRNEKEEKYLKFLSEGNYQPELLFGVGEIATRASLSPEAQWKVSNLRKLHSLKDQASSVPSVKHSAVTPTTASIKSALTTRKTGNGKPGHGPKP